MRDHHIGLQGQEAPPEPMSRRFTILLLTLGLVASACDNGSEGPDVEDPPYSTANDIVSLQLTPTFISLGSAESQPLTVTAAYEDGATADVTGSVDWVVPEEFADRVDMDGTTLMPLAVGRAQVYATLGPLTSNIITIEVGQFAYTVSSLVWDDVTYDPDDSVPQATVVQVTVEVQGRTLDPARPDLIEFAIDGLLPFGADRAEHGLDAYFEVVDDITYSGWFIVPPSALTGAHALSLVAEGIAGDTEDVLDVGSNILPPKTCDELLTDSTMEAFDERKYRINFGDFPRAYDIVAEASDGSSLDTALWLFSEDGELFSYTDDPWDGGTDAHLTMGITDRLRGSYYMMLTPSPLAEPAMDSGDFRLTCSGEEVLGDELLGETGTVIPGGGGPVELEIEVSGLAPYAGDVWLHMDLESDNPSLVTAVLFAPNITLSVGLRATGHDAEHMATTWGTVTEPDDPLYGMDHFAGTDALGTWTLQLESYSASGTTTLHDWRLYLDTTTIGPE
jgi:hypothetical protein